MSAVEKFNQAQQEVKTWQRDQVMTSYFPFTAYSSKLQRAM